MQIALARTAAQLDSESPRDRWRRVCAEVERDRRARFGAPTAAELAERRRLAREIDRLFAPRVTCMRVTCAPRSHARTPRRHRAAARPSTSAATSDGEPPGRGRAGSAVSL